MTRVSFSNFVLQVSIAARRQTDRGHLYTAVSHESVLAVTPLRLLPLVGAPPLPLTRYMPRLRKTLEAEERFWVTTGLGKTA